MIDTPRTVHLAIHPDWADWEPAHLVSRINSPEWQLAPGSVQVRTVASSLEPITSMGGIRVLPDTTFGALTPQDSAMLILPGGTSWDGDPTATDDAVNAAVAFVAAGVPVAATCGATAGLARAGLLDVRAHTSSALEYLQYCGGAYAGSAHYRDVPAVVDGGVITAGPTHPVEFARLALDELGLFAPEVLDAWYRLFGLQDPSAFEALVGAPQ